MFKKYINAAAISVQGWSTMYQRRRDYQAIESTTSRGRSHGFDGLQFNCSRTTSRGRSHGSHVLQFNYSHMIEFILHKPFLPAM